MMSTNQRLERSAVALEYGLDQLLIAARRLRDALGRPSDRRIRFQLRPLHPWSQRPFRQYLRSWNPIGFSRSEASTPSPAVQAGVDR